MVHPTGKWKTGVTACPEVPPRGKDPGIAWSLGVPTAAMERNDKSLLSCRGTGGGYDRYKGKDRVRMGNGSDITSL